jgi:predicted phosphodiesterase
MKTIAVGDIHGRDSWKRLAEQESFDQIIFLGDYFDSKENISAKA